MNKIKKNHKDLEVRLPLFHSCFSHFLPEQPWPMLFNLSVLQFPHVKAELVKSVKRQALRSVSGNVVDGE